MKLVAVFLLFLLTEGIIGANLNQQQGKLIAKNLNEKLSKSHLGKAILGLLEMQGEGQDLSKLYSALDLLKQDLLQKKADEEQLFASEQDAFEAEETRLQGLITFYEGQLIIFDQQLIDLQNEGSKLAADLVSQQKQLQQAKDGKQAEVDFLANLKISFEKLVEDYNRAISLLQQAVIILLDAKSSADSAGLPSFIQTKTNEFKSLSEGISKQLTKMNQSPILIKPITEFLQNFAKQGENLDPASIDGAINALNNLISFFQNGLQQAETDYNNTKQQHELLIQDYLNQISNLENTVIPKTNSEIEANSAAQDAKAVEITDTKTNKKFEEGNLDSLRDSWQKRVDIHNLLMPEYDNEYAVVVQAEQLLKQNYGF